MCRCGKDHGGDKLPKWMFYLGLAMLFIPMIILFIQGNL